MNARRGTGASGPTSAAEVVCPGCGIARPACGAAYERKFHASAECWGVFEEVIGREFQSALLFSRAHQLTVDAYAVQHAGGEHPDKSVAIHLAGLHLTLERGVALMDVPAWLQRIAGAAPPWPHFDPPPAPSRGLTVADVAATRSHDRHVDAVRAWGGQVWDAWRPHHAAARALAELGAPEAAPAKRPARRPSAGGPGPRA